MLTVKSDWFLLHACGRCWHDCQDSKSPVLINVSNAIGLEENKGISTVMLTSSNSFESISSVAKVPKD